MAPGVDKKKSISDIDFGSASVSKDYTDDVQHNTKGQDGSKDSGKSGTGSREPCCNRKKKED